MTLYGFGLLLTAWWTAWEAGSNPWGQQSRLLAPLILYWASGWHGLSFGNAGRNFNNHCLGFLSLALLHEAEPAAAVDSASGFIPATSTADWRNYGNDANGSRFSPATQITPANISMLKPAWTFRTGAKTGIGFEATPLMIRDTLYFCTATNVIIALDAETGHRRWQIYPKVDAPPTPRCRGVAYFEVPEAKGQCASRIIFATGDGRLMAADSGTGSACRGFGIGGTVDLKRGLGEVRRGYYFVSSAPTIVRGRIVVGGWVMDNRYVGEPSGVVRAFDATTGRFAWAWDMDRPDAHGEPPAGQSYSRGTANAWVPMSGDAALGLVYVPTGNATPDGWGAHRSPGSEKYGSAVVALDIRTGQARWHFQTTHHDLWDYDVPAQPTLIDLPINGKIVPALIQPTKRGQIFVLDRRNGQPVLAVAERPAPQGAARGDFVSPTQPTSVEMPAFDDTRWTESMMWGLTPLDQLWCRIRFRQARFDGSMTPPGIKPTITYPSHLGGINWGGVAIDPQPALMAVNWNRIANYTRLVPRPVADAMNVAPSRDGNFPTKSPLAQMGTPFAMSTAPLLSPLAVPYTQPPFGKIAVVNLRTKKVIWSRPLGNSTDTGPFGVASRLDIPMGLPNLGGSLITRSGLLFIAATPERAIRAYDIKSGHVLWSSRLPAGGHATAMTYISPRSWRQFIVIAAGGHGALRSPPGDHLVAFALRR